MAAVRPHITPKKGSRTKTTDKGISNIVALSSMYLNRGHSEATQIGPISAIRSHGVPNQYPQAAQIKPTPSVPAQMTADTEKSFLRISPSRGSPSDRLRMSGYAYAFSGARSKTIPIAIAPHAKADTLLGLICTLSNYRNTKFETKSLSYNGNKNDD